MDVRMIFKKRYEKSRKEAGVVLTAEKKAYRAK